MARNVELKAAVTDFARVTEALVMLSPEPGVLFAQEDTFFHCPRGRLKLRRLSAAIGELIYYERPDGPGPKTSHYVLTATTEPDRLREVLADAYGITGVVRKRRLVRMVGRTRVHLDEVESLGRFVELEVVLDEAERIEDGMNEAYRLMALLGIHEEQLVGGAYVDMLQAAGSAPPR